MSTAFVPSVQLLRSLSQALRAYPSKSLLVLSSTQCLYRTISTGRSRREKQYLTPEYTHSRRRDGELQPRPLSRPLGLPYPPKSGQNTGRDTRTLKQRRDDFASYEKHRKRQAELVASVFERNYFRDIGNLGKVHKGKSIIAPSTPFKSGVALYFPNLEGLTLEGSGIGFGKIWAQTTDKLSGKVSVITLQHTTWAESQVQSFVSKNENPALAEMMKDYAPAQGLAQHVTINVEENPVKAFMVRLFFGRLRRKLPKQGWDTYFLNRRGLGEDIRDALAMWNSKVGYVYLVDGQCRIRWAANGFAKAEERQSLVRCLRRLVDEAKGVQRSVRREDPRPTADAEAQREARPKVRPEVQPVIAAS